MEGNVVETDTQIIENILDQSAGFRVTLRLAGDFTQRHMDKKIESRDMAGMSVSVSIFGAGSEH